MNLNKILTATTVLALAVGAANAQRTFEFSFEANLTASSDTNPGLSGLGQEFRQDQRFRTTIGAYPTLSLKSVGRNSLFSAYVGYGTNRVFNTDIDLDSESVTAGAKWQWAFGRNWNLRFSENFTRSPDFSTLNLFRGILFTPEGVFFDYETVALRRNSFANQAELDVDYNLGGNAKLVFGAAHSLRDYAENPQFRRRLSDQTRASAYVRYSKEISARTGWDVEYRLSYFEFRDFESARTHDPGVGFYHRFSPDLTLRVSAGPSYTEAQGSPDSYMGYHGSVSVTKELNENRFTLSVSRRNGTSTGLGSISDVIRVGMGWSRPLGDHVRLDLAASYYDTRRRLDNPITTRGPQASAKISFDLLENVALEVGGNYQDQNGSQTFEIDRKRVFATIRFSWPDFWRFRR